MTEVLKMFELAQQDGVSQMQIGRSRIEIQLSRAAACLK
jgi:hypothetical protein